MRIAVIALFLPPGAPGGAALQAHYIANELVRRRHEVTVFSLFDAGPEARYEVRRVTLPRPAQALQRRLMGTAMLTFPVAVARQSFAGWDVVHAHGDSHFLPAAVPVVRTFHSTGLDQLLNATTWRRRAGMGVIYPLEIVSGIRARERVFVSENLARYYPFESKRVIPNAVDLDLFHPGAAKSSQPSILFVAGTAAGRKRGRYLADVFETRIRPRVPGAELWMVCPEPMTGNDVHWLGPRYGEDLADIYRRAWVLCLPSTHETFGVPFVEAMASGTAVVATPNAGAIEVLKGGRYGVIAADGGLGNTLVHLLQDGAARNGFAALGIERAAAFSLSTVVDAYEALFESVASRSY